MLLFTIPVVAFVAAELYQSVQPPSHKAPVKLPVAPKPRHVGLPASGIDYYAPTSSINGCPDWTWLQTRCYQPRSSLATSGRVSGKTVLTYDLDFMQQQDVGGFSRVWVSLDQLMRWNQSTGFSGFVPARLHHLDAALSAFDAKHLKVDLVVYAYEKASGWRHEFRPEALNGDHRSMRTNYLQALRLFIGHLASKKSDEQTVGVVDLMNEPYFQLERYFDTPKTLGVYRACRTAASKVSSSCVDTRIIHPWLEALYKTARSVSHAFLYTESDSGRLLDTNAADQAHWMSMYPVDVYDIHLYDSAPWKHTNRWATALHLKKPWFSGEVGCDSGDIGCTYSGTNAAPVDQWWLDNLGKYRAQSVLLEDRGTVWSYPSGTATLTATGKILQCHADSKLTGCGNIRGT